MTVIRHPNNQGVTLQQWRKTAAGGETSLSGTDDFSAGLAYTVGAEEVFVNGVLIERGVDYTATSGTSVTLTNALVAGDLATVSSPSAFNVANAIPKATVTAKGDVIVGTAASTVTNLAVGADGTTLVANSASATGVAWAGPTFAAGKNKIINGDFRISQRGQTFTSPTIGQYLLDRINLTYTNAYPTTYSVTQQAFTAGTAPVAGYEGQYFFRSTITTVGSSTTMQFQHPIEDVRTFAGQTVTMSFWAKADSARTVSFYLNQNPGSGGTGGGIINGGGANFTLSTAWQRYSFTLAVPSISGMTIGTGSYFGVLFAQAAASGSVLDIWGMQLEAGSVATPFTTATGTLQGELMACQRYLPATTGISSEGYVGYAYGTNSVLYAIPFPTQARVAPTGMTLSSGISVSGYGLNVAYSITNLTFNGAGSNSATVYTPSGVTVTAGQGSRMGLNGTILFTGCEL